MQTTYPGDETQGNMGKSTCSDSGEGQKSEFTGTQAITLGTQLCDVQCMMKAVRFARDANPNTENRGNCARRPPWGFPRS